MDQDSELDSKSSGLSSSLPDWARPALPRPELDFEPGDVINDRFEVLELIGAGGMGQVYRVQDRRSGNLRALKTLKGEFILNKEIIRRFERELSDAQQITHPNVCRVYDIDSAHQRTCERPFYTMELLVGETLAQRLQRDYPLRPKEALRITRGIAAGLDAAHTTGGGIIHRDLKPANIMLVNGPEGIRPIILDFGIAKRLTAGLETGTGLSPGTPAYMAPEQKQGKAVSASTDVYALALVFTEMLSHADAARYHRVLDRALSPDPNKRYQTAGAMARALARVNTTRRLWLMGAGTAITATGASLFRWRDLPPSGVPLIVMAPVESTLRLSGSKPLEPKAVFRLLQHQIAQSSSIDLVAPDRLASRIQELNGGRIVVNPDTAMLRRAAVAEGAPYVLFSELGQLGGRLQLWLTLERNGRVIENETFPFSEPGDLPSVCTDGAEWVREKLHRPGLKPRDPGLPELTTASWDALQAYVRGDEAWKEHRQEDAAHLFEEALRIDPEFAGAEARLGDILMASSRTDEALTHWGKAASLVKTKALAGREMLRIRGVFALDTGDTAEAEKALALFVATYPEDPLARYYYSGVAMRLNRADEALEMMQKAVKLAPTNYSLRVGLARVHLFRADLKLAQGTLNDAMSLQPEHGGAKQGLAAIAFAESRFDDCRSLLESIVNQANEASQSSALNGLACLEAELGRPDAALQWIEKGIDLDRRLNLVSSLRQKLRLKAEYFLLQKDDAKLAEISRQILNMKTGAQSDMEAGCLLARAGAIKKAEECRVTSVPDWPIYRHWQTRLEGEITLARGEGKKALAIMLQAPPRADHAYWPEFIFRAAVAAGDMAQARVLAQSLTNTLAYRWIDPERTALGFVRMVHNKLR